MPTFEYRIITRQVNERERRYDITLPVDMGASNERISDRFMRQVAEQGSIDLEGLEKIGTIGEGDEEITTVYRDDVQVWPRLRKKREPAKKPEIPKEAYDDSELPYGPEDE